ncbi:UDP-glucuronic acid decarboxylase family protein [Burkholderia sp. Ac-20353]|uniref:UDP-glucuronic acid decarboxylase family protein n=1 Tax=Burkholderia sp. Ac-20353 TaxID=2703894 RepID=UPI00197B9C70|nr:UDP-glucuronic acid decarboxylase family protein [Burkholderia sp. Ac-20353]MBN3789617.1 SDR family oxidoreductase [Burkholderia sp. Ac-20353]
MTLTRFRNSKDMPTTIVTGGAGFLGSYVCERLLAEGAQVICIDNLMTGRRCNVAHLRSSPRFALIEADICATLPDIDVDEIWNLACPASPPSYQVDPTHTLLTNVMGTKHCLDLGRKTGARVFQASTSEVYGDPEVHPQVETYCGHVNSTGPRACYDEGKRAAETLCFDYRRSFGVDIRVARIFNTYGPRMNPKDGRVVSNFIVQALLGDPVEIYGDGQQTRSFCFVTDLIDGFFRLMRSPAEVTGPINLGNPSEFTMQELARLVIEMTRSSSSISAMPLPIDDPKKRCPDISMAEKLLDWRPTVSLKDGLAATIDYFCNELWLSPVAAPEPTR